MNKPRYEHDCNNCVFIDQYTNGVESYDMYLCKKDLAKDGVDYSEFVLRFSDYGPDYFATNVMSVYRNRNKSFLPTGMMPKYEAAIARALQLGMLDVENLVRQDELYTKYER